jgi:hypothetical protein
MKRTKTEIDADLRRSIEMFEKSEARFQELAQRRANAPLLPKVAQEPRHELGGLFGDSHDQK